MTTPLPETVNALDLSILTGCTKRWIQELAERGTIQKSGRGDYPLVGSIKAIIAFHKKTDEPARERLTKAQASREERKDRMEAAEDIHADVVFKQWENVILIFRERMLRVANNVQSKCGLTEIQRKAIEQEVSDGLRELDKKIVYTAEQIDAAEEKETEAK